MQVLFEIMVQIKQKRGIGIINRPPPGKASNSRPPEDGCNWRYVFEEQLASNRGVRAAFPYVWYGLPRELLRLHAIGHESCPDQRAVQITIFAPSKTHLWCICGRKFARRLPRGERRGAEI